MQYFIELIIVTILNIFDQLKSEDRDFILNFEFWISKIHPIILEALVYSHNFIWSISFSFSLCFDGPGPRRLSGESRDTAAADSVPLSVSETAAAVLGVPLTAVSGALTTDSLTDCCQTQTCVYLLV